MEKSASRNKKRRIEVDRISGLPDPLLIHILSFLPAKEAVATSLLSKRWRPLWRSLSTLHFNRRSFRSVPFFYRFVDKVLKLVDLKSVKKLVIKLDYFGPPDYFRPGNISKWIDALISNKIEHLELHLGLLKPHWRPRLPLDDDVYVLPSTVFSASSIKVLKLCGEMRMVESLSHANLPLLEVLHLENVYFPDVRSLEMLLSSCPLLKHLVLKVKNLGVDNVDYDYYPLDVGGLNHLVTAEAPEFLLPVEVLSNATFLRLHPPKYLGPTWPFRDDVPMFYNLTHLECVADGWIEMVNCLHNFPKLQKLVISEIIESSPGEPMPDVPPCVSSRLKEFSLLQFVGDESEFEMIRYIVKNAGVLRTVSIRTVRIGSGSDDWRDQICKELATYLRSGSETCNPKNEQKPELLLM